MKKISSITPAILPKSFDELETELNQIVEADMSDWVQIDAVDGVFAQNKTWPYEGDMDMMFSRIISQAESLPHADELSFEVDLMVSDPAFEADKWIAAGASRLIVHIDSLRYDAFLELAKKISAKGVELILGFGVHSSFEKLEIFIKSVAESKMVDGIQCMGIEKIGFQGQPFDEEVLKNIKNIKENFPSMPVSVDGGVNKETAKKLIDAGADRLVVGSALFKEKSVADSISKFAEFFAH